MSVLNKNTIERYKYLFRFSIHNCFILSDMYGNSCTAIEKLNLVWDSKHDHHLLEVATAKIR